MIESQREKTLSILFKKDKIKNILDSEDIDDFYYNLNEINKLLPENEFDKKSFHNVTFKIDETKLDQPFISATEAFGSLLYLLWYMCVVSITVIFSVFCSVILLSGLAVAGLGFYVTNKLNARKREEQDNELKLLTLKIDFINAIFKKVNDKSKDFQDKTDLSIACEADEKKSPKKKSSEKKSSDILDDLKKIFKSILVVFNILSTLIYITYCMGSVLLACGLFAIGSLLMGTFGIGAAFLICLPIGIYFGYQHFKALTNEEKFEELEGQTKKEFKTQWEAYKGLCKTYESNLNNEKISNLEEEIKNLKETIRSLTVPKSTVGSQSYSRYSLDNNRNTFYQPVKQQPGEFQVVQVVQDQQPAQRSLQYCANS